MNSPKRRGRSLQEPSNWTTYVEVQDLMLLLMSTRRPLYNFTVVIAAGKIQVQTEAVCRLLG